MASKLVQIVYTCPQSTAEDKARKCFPFAEIYNNDGKLTPFFENSVLAEVVMKSKSKNTAVCSWRLKEKLRWYIGKPREITPELLDGDYEVLSFTKNSRSHEMLAFAEASHPGFTDMFRKILAAIGKDWPFEVKIPVYQNHFSCRTDIYRQYVTNWLQPAIEAMTNDKELNGMIMRDANYSKLSGSDGRWLEPHIGIPYWPYAPFLLERLFSVFRQSEKVNIQHL